jgi:hypothetical protein
MGEVIYINDGSIKITGPDEVPEDHVLFFVSSPAKKFTPNSVYVKAELRRLECVDVVSAGYRNGKVLEVLLRKGHGKTHEERKRIAYQMAGKLYARFIEKEVEDSSQ